MNALIYIHKQPEADHYAAYIEDMLTQRNLAEVYHNLNTFNISVVDNEVVKGASEVKQMSHETMNDLGENA